MNRKLVVAIVFAGIAVTVRAATPVDDYAYAWPLRTAGNDAAWQVVLTPEIYAVATRADLGDVEVVDANGAPVASTLQRLPTTIASEGSPRSLALYPLPARGTAAGDAAVALHVRRGDDGKVRSLDARIDDRAPAASTDAARDRVLIADARTILDPLATLLIDWDHGADTVTAQFAVDASDDLQQWRVVATNAAVLRLVQAGETLERHDVALGGIRAPYLRLRRLDDGPPLRGLRVAVRSIATGLPAQGAVAWVATDPIGSESSATASGSRGGSAAGGTIYRYRLPAALSIEALRVSLADDNAVAPLSLYWMGADGTRAVFGNVTAFRLRQGSAIVENDELHFAPAGRFAELRVETTVPLAHPPTVAAAYRPDRLVFLAQGGGPFRLVAGSATHTRGAYPVATALAPLRASLGADWQPPIATLGFRATLAGDRALVQAPAPRDWRTWILWAVLASAALLIGGLALRLARSAPQGD